MTLLFDKDERSVTEKIREYSRIFNEIGNEFKIVSFRSDIAELILDARIEERMKFTDEDFDTAEAAIIKELEATKQ